MKEEYNSDELQSVLKFVGWLAKKYYINIPERLTKEYKWHLKAESNEVAK